MSENPLEFTLAIRINWEIGLKSFAEQNFLVKELCSYSLKFS